jgi:two-component system, OmpR family, KDP operon response regulator KdpE
MSAILLVEDDPGLRRALVATLRSARHGVIEAPTGEEALRVLMRGGADLIVLDLGLPDMDGLDFLRRVRVLSAVPVIVLTARDLQRDKVEALDAGADDYVTKPFDTDELLARIRAALRRGPQTEQKPAHLVIDDLDIDMEKRLVRLDGEVVHLTRTELELLEVLVAHPGQLLTQEFLLRTVWGPEYGTESNYLRVYVGQLRKKLRDDAARPRLILTEPGVGYRWIASDLSDSP